MKTKRSDPLHARSASLRLATSCAAAGVAALVLLLGTGEATAQTRVAALTSEIQRYVTALK